MRIIKLTIQNFKGVKSHTIEPNEMSVNIYGANESGKTTLADAVTWLLFDKDTLGRSPAKFGIKTLDPATGEPINYLNHQVEAVFRTKEFNTLTLRKVYKEKWTTSKGASKTELTGHTTDYFVNDVPTSAGEYTRMVEEQMSEQLFKMLTTPHFFAETMSWQDRRKILFQLASDVTEADVIATDKKFKQVAVVLAPYANNADPIADFKKVANAKRAEINKKLLEIPARIDELNGMIPDIDMSPEAQDKANTDRVRYRKEREQAMDRLSQTTSANLDADIQAQITNLKSRQVQIETELRAQALSATTTLEAQLSAEQQARQRATSNQSNLRHRIEAMESKMKSWQAEIEAEKRSIDFIKNENPQPNNQPKGCPTCGQDLPADKILTAQSNYESYVREFNASKGAKIKEKTARIEQWNKEIAEASETYGVLKKELDAINAEVEAKSKAIDSIQASINAAASNAPTTDKNPEYQQNIIAISQLQAQVVNAAKELEAKRAEIRAEIDTITEALQQAEATFAKMANYTDVTNRIAGLGNDRRVISKNLEDIEADLRLIEDYVKARAAFVTESVNKRFRHVKWQLFRDQINGGMEDICEPVYKGVPYSGGLNTAGRIQAGLDIIRTLSEHYGVSAPILLDNFEAVTEPIDRAGLQVFGFIASQHDRTLRVEVAA